MDIVYIILDKYFNIFKDAKKDVENNPFLLKEIVPKFVDKSLKSSHFYLHKVWKMNIEIFKNKRCYIFPKSNISLTFKKYLEVNSVIFRFYR